MGHQLFATCLASAGSQATADVDGRQLAMLALASASSSRFSRSRSAFSVSACECTDTYSPGGHRQRAGEQPGDAGDEDAGVRGVGRRDAEHQAGGRDDAVVGAEHRGAQPADAIGAMALAMSSWCFRDGLPRIRSKRSARAVASYVQMRTSDAPYTPSRGKPLSSRAGCAPHCPHRAVGAPDDVVCWRWRRR